MSYSWQPAGRPSSIMGSPQRVFKEELLVLPWSVKAFEERV